MLMHFDDIIAEIETQHEEQHKLGVIEIYV
jgi:hypothetical protein